MACGGKPYILDCMYLLKAVWKGECDGKYVSEEGIKRCWKKASILPISWEANINADVGRNIAKYKKTVSNELCLEIYDLMSKMKVKATEVCLDTNDASGVVHKDTFVAEDISSDDLATMVEK